MDHGLLNCDDALSLFELLVYSDALPLSELILYSDVLLFSELLIYDDALVSQGLLRDLTHFILMDYLGYLVRSSIVDYFVDTTKSVVI